MAIVISMKEQQIRNGKIFVLQKLEFIIIGKLFIISNSESTRVK